MTIEEFKDECPLDGLVEQEDEYKDFDNAYEKLLDAFQDCYYNELTEDEQKQIENDSIGLLNEMATFLRNKRYGRNNK